MPKKTRKEKILALYRKKLRLLERPTPVPMAEPKPKIKVTNDNMELSDEEKQITHYFSVDLKKSLILIAIVITLEISLYFATIKHYLKF